MRFLTSEVYDAWYRYSDERTIDGAFKSYYAYLDQIVSTLPSHVWLLTRLPSVDDSLVIKVTWDASARTLILILRSGDNIVGYYDLVLRYEGVEISPEHLRILAQVARDTKGHRHHRNDLFAHEVDLVENNQIEHRLHFHPGVWFVIRCNRVEWEKLPRQNRTLPQLGDRFRCVESKSTKDDSAVQPAVNVFGAKGLPV